MRTLSLLVVPGFVVATGVSHADFTVLRQDSPAAPTPAARGDQPSTATPLPPRAGKTTDGTAPPAQPPAPPRFFTAYGFGRQIPLAFAVRQIVPPLVKLTWGPGANPTALVDWQGDRPWNVVLRDTVRPLGLHLTMHQMEVTISR
jgi:hypothetical protein